MFEFTKIWFHIKSEWQANWKISTLFWLSFTFWKFLEHSVREMVLNGIKRLTFQMEHFSPKVQQRNNTFCSHPSKLRQPFWYSLRIHCPNHLGMCKDAVYEKRGPLVSMEWFPGSLRIAKPEMRSLQNKRKMVNKITLESRTIYNLKMTL